MSHLRKKLVLKIWFRSDKFFIYILLDGFLVKARVIVSLQQLQA